MKKEINYVDVRCPECKELLLSHPDTDYRYGSPIGKCPKCGADYSDPFVHEIAIDGIRTEPKLIRTLIKDEVIILILSAILIVLNIVSVVLNNVSFLMIFLTVAMLLAAVFKLVSFFAAKNSHVKELSREREASKARMQNPEYAKKLAAAGYNVPKEYL